MRTPSLLIKQHLLWWGCLTTGHIPLQRKPEVTCFHVHCDVLIFHTGLSATSSFICVCVCVLLLMCLYAGVHEYSCQHRLFFSFLLLHWCNHILALSWWQLVGMHIVIKQFPVCKCPVYTFLLQSLSLDRLLEYEESSYMMRNENSKTSIKKSIVPTLNSRHAWNWCHTEDFDTTTHTHTNYRKIKATIHNSSITACW